MKKEQGNLNYVAMEEEMLKFWQNNDVFAKMQEDNKLLELYKELLNKYSGLKFMILYTNLDNAKIAFSAPKALQMLQDKKQFLIFEDISGIKLTDMTLSQKKNYSKSLENDEAYFIQENQVRKLKLIREM